MAYKQKSAEAKRKEIAQLTEDRDAQVEKFFTTPEDMKEYLSFMSKFYTYSPRNSILIQKQFQGAEAVGSFDFWKKKGYSVQKGEKGLKVFVPVRYKTFIREENGKKKSVSVKYATKAEKEAIEKKEIETKDHLTYRVGHVFDVSQTNAKAEDLPKIFPNKWLEGEVANYDEMFQSLNGLAEKMNVEIMEEPHRELGAAKGAYIEYQQLNKDGQMENHKGIELNPRNSELNNIKTIIHELAHAKLHHSSTEHSKNLNHNEKEFQAEMTAYTVCSHFNIDTSDYSLNYLHTYTKDHDQINDKLTLLEEVKDTSYTFITHLEQDISKTKEIEDTLLSNQELQDRFSNVDVIIHGDVHSIGDLSRDDFAKTFTDQYGNNILNHGNIRGKELFEQVAAFNQMNEPWTKHGDSVKMLDTNAKAPQAYIEWSETHLDRRVMNVSDMDKMLAQKNLESLQTIGYDKTRVRMIIPEEKRVEGMDRMDLGDGHYHDLKSHVEETASSLKEFVPDTQEHLKGVYTKEAISNTLHAMYKNDFYNRSSEMGTEEARRDNIRATEDFSVTHHYLSSHDVKNIQQQAQEDYLTHKEEMDAANTTVQLKDSFQQFQEKAWKEKSGELSEDNIVDRMAAENQYTALKLHALKSNALTESSIVRMEKNVRKEMEDTPFTKRVKDTPFEKKTPHQKNSSFSM
ncbi:ArdC-like ssDNA-binding domain-containing protein [Alteribacillus bidgolensis]|uniref:Uncharacterized protein n=1 Tax=Alteribacillus bidgolensis TaxID=930129 RepID=A0A1G8Q799_9BACI|nr:ArdC-like ssDNA-binding domain-containing protein [Alteribacillus bidgolensis]SDJ00446.1 protein of unknown function [Alteribacillus bidgolensis]